MQQIQTFHFFDAVRQHILGVVGKGNVRNLTGLGQPAVKEL